MPRERSVRVAAIGTSTPRSGSSTQPARASAVARRRAVVAVLTIVSLALVTVYFRESDGGGMTAGKMFTECDVARPGSVHKQLRPSRIYSNERFLVQSLANYKADFIGAAQLNLGNNL